VNANGTVSANNPGGGFVRVRVIEGVGSAAETLVIFANRSNPGLIKVCKIAGPGIPENTLFRFRVQGTGPTAADQFGAVDQIVDVSAGRLADTGGTCQFVPGFGGTGTQAGLQLFTIGTPVTVTELGISPSNTIPVPAGQIRVGRIRTSGQFTSTAVAGFSPNPDMTPGPGRLGRAAVFARRDVVEVEFTNFIFNPTALKICKIAGAGVAAGTSFTFDVALVSPTSTGGVLPGVNPLFPAFSVPVTVSAGPAVQGGNCTLVNGGGLLGGAFNIGSTITITERTTTPATVVTTITSPTSTGTGLVGDIVNRRATLSGVNGLVAGINTVTFTNARAVIAPPTPSNTRFDFDGDGKADKSIYRPNDNIWHMLGTQSGFSSVQFGLATDKIVPADYDGDGKTDVAVYRDGTWYVQRSSAGFFGFAFGAATDIPQPADFDGDGKAELAVFRPSNGVWYSYNLATNQINAVAFGQAGDKPVIGDYDGDKKADVSVFRPSNGFWYRINSSSGDWSSIPFGAATDSPVPADYDGDGKTDIAVYRSGTWYLLRSTAGFTGVAFGAATDKPVPADFDGDGKVDIGVFRPSLGVWYTYNLATNQFDSVAFGTTGDKPIPAAMLQ
jgi:hypothetical protein